MTGKPEVIGSSVGLVPRNALVLSGPANFRVVGYSETIVRNYLAEKLAFCLWVRPGTAEEKGVFQAVLGRWERGRMPGAPPAAAAAAALRGSSLDFEATGASGTGAGAAPAGTALIVAPESGLS